MSVRWARVSMSVIALVLVLFGVEGPGGGRLMLPAHANPATSAPSASPSPVATQDADYYAYATRYYLQYLSSREKSESSAKDPYHFFNYYHSYRERYAPNAASSGRQGTPAWLSSMPFRTPRTQAFARFIQVASPSAAPAVRWARPVQDFQRAAGK